MHYNHQYQLKWAQWITKSRKRAIILDYGCGLGKVVLEGRKRGLDILGADVFYGSSPSIREKIIKAGLLNKIIYEIKNNKLEFSDNYFDLIMSNMVFEHIENFDIILKEIKRVMKNDGFFLCLFPSKGSFIEGHIGIPCAHWFSKNSILRYFFVLILRNLGMGYHKRDIPKSQWTKNSLNWLDKYTFYKPENEIIQIFSKYFKIRFIEYDYIIFRVLLNRKLKKTAFFFKMPLPSQTFLAFLFRKFVFMVILTTKK